MAGTSPVISVLDAVEPLDEELLVASTTVASGPGRWVPVAALLEDDALLDGVVADIAASWSTDRVDIACGALLSDIAFSVMHRGGIAFLAGRRVPLPALDDLAIRMSDEGHIDAMALGTRAACLPGDAAADDADTLVLVDEEALLAALVDAVGVALEPLVERLHVRSRRPRAALRRHVGDCVAEGLLWAGETIGRREEAFTWGPRACDAAPAWMRCRSDYRVWEVGDVVQVGRVRSQCCLYYRTDNARYCFSCPLKDDAHRLERLQPDPSAEDAA